MFIANFTNGQDTIPPEKSRKSQEVLEQIQKYLKIGGWIDAQ